MAGTQILVFATAFVLAFSCFAAAGRSSQNILVLLDDESIKTSHSIFFDSLTARGHKLDFSLATADVKLQKFGEYFYDSLILFAPTVEEFGGTLDVAGILEFIDTGHNVLVAASSRISETIRELADECGVEFDDDDAYVIDHLNYDVRDDSGQHTLIVADDVISSQIILGGPLSAPILYKGIGQVIRENNPLVYKILSGSATSYSYIPTKAIKDSPLAAGTNTLLVTSLQARNNARVTFSGSLDLFSNKFFGSSIQKYSPGGSPKVYPKSGNEQFATELTKWTFQERGLLRVENVRFAVNNGSDFPKTIRIKDTLTYSAKIEEYKDGKWVPFKASDVQLEFTMLSPFVRVNLKHDDQGLFFTSFQVPDVYGVFKLFLHYRRIGYGTLTDSKQVAVRPFHTDEYERFIVAAFPYYASSFMMMVGFFVFGLVFLYSKDSSAPKSKSQ